MNIRVVLIALGCCRVTPGTASTSGFIPSLLLRQDDAAAARGGSSLSCLRSCRSPRQRPGYGNRQVYFLGKKKATATNFVPSLSATSWGECKSEGDDDAIDDSAVVEPSRTTWQANSQSSQKIDATIQRRRFLGRAAVLFFSLSTTALEVSFPSASCGAYDRTYPDQLYSSDAGSETSERDRRIRQVLDRQEQRRSLTSGLGRARHLPSSSSATGTSSSRASSSSLLGSGLWASALWLASGSRSNPIATPLANLLYDQRKEPWLQDRNEGLFADLPPPLLGALALMYGTLGFAVHHIVSLLASSPGGGAATAMISGSGSGSGTGTSLQLAAVCLIGGATLELGRVASGEKMLTRVESDRDDLLRKEFQDFADSRLQLGGTCHRLDVVRAFRRYYGKYRTSDNPEFPLSDVEIEQLLRNWSLEQGPAIERSSSGFYAGVRINPDADAFAPR